MLLLRVIWAVVRALFSKKADLVAENLAVPANNLVRPLDSKFDSDQSQQPRDDRLYRKSKDLDCD